MGNNQQVVGGTVGIEGKTEKEVKQGQETSVGWFTGFFDFIDMIKRHIVEERINFVGGAPKLSYKHNNQPILR